MTAAPLPACPFCGADGEDLRVLPPNCTPQSPYSLADRAYPVLRCGGCGASVPGEDWDTLGASAIAAWNRRAPEAQAWRPAPGWEEHYEVSCYGAVRTKSRRLVTLYHRADGYVVCRLSQPRATVRVHRLVALAFLPKSDKPCVNHIDADTANNVVSNLEWCTQQENIAHASRLGRLSSHQKGKVGPNAMMSREDVTKIRERALTSTHRKIAEEYGVARSTISRIVNGETYGAWTAPHREATNV